MDGTTSDKNKGSHFQQWEWKSNELQKALDEWQKLSEGVQGPAPAQQMLQDMQKLIKEIQSKLEQFSESNV